MLKRFFDVFVSLFALLLFSIPLLVIFLLVRQKIGKPVLFVQLRPGIGGRPFKLFKFRTMTNKRGPDGQLLPDHLRMTNFGLLLRSTSLDELPELWNVLSGDMSLIGPRPLLMDYIPFYSAEQARRHDVKPGLTGWAQINGRNAISWEEKFRLDVWYVDHHCFWLDLRIFLITIWKVIRCEGISADGEATMAPFSGSANPSEAP